MHHSQLITKARGGDRRATEELLNTYRNYLHVLAQIQTSRRLQAKMDASDLVQETCMAACRDFAKFRGQSERELLGWLRTILANTGGKMIRHYKGTRRRDVSREQGWGASLDQSDAALGGLASPVSTPSQGAARREAAVIVADKLAELPDHYRQVIVLHYFDGLKIVEVAEKMKRSPEAISSLLSRAVIKLRLLMKGDP